MRRRQHHKAGREECSRQGNESGESEEGKSVIQQKEEKGQKAEFSRPNELDNSLEQC